uniref:RNA-directed DNA polymerase from mobile element jockey n=1 Tax=Hirondellea gigas TaxID=1518452 RepID=A0A6A7FT79_9CRUS
MTSSASLICALQETRWHPVHNPPPPFYDYTIFFNYHPFSDFAHARGGTALIVHNSLQASSLDNLPLPNPSSPEIDSELCSVWISLNFHSFQVALGNIYVPPQSYRAIPLLDPIFSRLPSRTIICGDFNAKHPSWDSFCASPNTAGRSLQRLIDDHNLHILNSSEFTHRQSPLLRPSVIDLTLVSNDLAPKVDWTISHHLTGGHRPIHITINKSFSTTSPAPRPPKWRLSAPNVKLFKAACESKFLPLLNHLHSSDNTEMITSEISNSLHQVGLDTIGLRSQKHHSPKPWITPKIKSLITARNKARRKNQPDIYTRLRNQVRFAISQAKLSSDTKFLRKICSSSSSAFIWKALSKFCGQKRSNIFPPLTYNDTVADTPVQQAEVLIQHFQSISTPSDHFDKSFENFITEKLANSRKSFDPSDQKAPYNAPITTFELEPILSKLKNTAVGPDNIPNWFLRHASPSLKTAILDLFNKSFLQGRFPNTLKVANIVAIPKPKKDHSLPKSYRPISLLNTLSRVFESIIQKRLYYFCESTRALPNSQSAYRKYRSCIDPLILLTQSAHANFNRSRPTIMVQLDFSKAFDSVWSDALKLKLLNLGLKGNLLSWISSFISNRQYRMSTPHTTDYHHFPLGVFQGSILSPLLFLIFVADCASTLTSFHAEFADDLTLWYSADTIEETIRVLNSDLRKLEIWANKWRLTFSLTKCTYSAFSKNRRFDPQSIPKLFFFGIPLTYVKYPRLLGLNLDPELSFSHHISQICTSGLKKVNLLRRLMGTPLQSNRPALLILVKGFIRPTLEYASELFHSISTSSSLMLERVQASALRIITGATRNTPHEILNMECGISSLRLRRDQSILRKLNKIQALPADSLLRDSLTSWWFNDRSFEPINTKRPCPSDVPTKSETRSFFGCAYQAHQQLLECHPNQTFPLISNPNFHPPWRVNPIDINYHQDFRSILRKALRRFQALDYTNSDTCQFFKSLHPAHRPLWPHSTLRSFTLSRIIFRLRSGFCKLGAHRHFGALNQELCPNCNQTDTIEHLLFNCPAHSHSRAIFLSKIVSIANQPATLQLLLGFPPNLSNHALTSIATLTALFVQKTNRSI